MQSQGALHFLENSIHRISLRSLRTIAHPIQRSLHWVAEDRKCFQQNPESYQDKLWSVFTHALKGSVQEGNSFLDHNNDLMNRFALYEKNGILIPHKNVILGISPYETLEQHAKNGQSKTLFHFNGVMPFDFPYVSLISQNHNLVHGILNKKDEIVYRSYVTPLIAAILYQHTGEFQEFNAVKIIWNSLSDLIAGYFKKGDRVEFLLSLTAPQYTTEEDAKEQAEYLGVPSNQLTEYLCGGGLQICVIRSPSHCYTLKKSRLIQGLYAERNKDNGLFENPMNVNPVFAQSNKIRSHILDRDLWRKEKLLTRNFFRWRKSS